MLVLGPEPESSAKTTRALTAEPLLQPSLFITIGTLDVFSFWQCIFDAVIDFFPNITIGFAFFIAFWFCFNFWLWIFLRLLHLLLCSKISVPTESFPMYSSVLQNHWTLGIEYVSCLNHRSDVSMWAI